MKANHFSADIIDFFRVLNKHGVQYLIVGGEAVIYYGYPRLTGDVDFFYGSSKKNISSLFDALNEFWDGDIPGIKAREELAYQGYVIQFGVPPNRIDLMNSIEGVEFEEAWEQKNQEYILIDEDKTPVCFLSLKHLIDNKRRVGRDKDLDDLVYLEKILPS